MLTDALTYMTFPVMLHNVSSDVSLHVIEKATNYNDREHLQAIVDLEAPGFWYKDAIYWSRTSLLYVPSCNGKSRTDARLSSWGFYLVSKAEVPER